MTDSARDVLQRIAAILEHHDQYRQQHLADKLTAICAEALRATPTASRVHERDALADVLIAARDEAVKSIDNLMMPAFLTGFDAATDAAFAAFPASLREPGDRVAAKPVAWAILESGGNIRMWSTINSDVEAFAARIGAIVTPLYAAPAAVVTPPADDLAAFPIRAGINILLEIIAGRLEAWDTWDMFRSDAAALVRSYKHAAPATAADDLASGRVDPRMTDHDVNYYRLLLVNELTTPRQIEEYDEDMGAVLWWKFPIEEAPYVGSRNDIGRTVEVNIDMAMWSPTGQEGEDERHTLRRNVGGWPGYHTHFTPLPIPKVPHAE